MKKTLAIISNFILVALCIVGIVLTIKNVDNSFAYYTFDSNILSAISSLCFIFFVIKDKEIPKWVLVFRYVGTVCLALTLCVVLFILIPTTQANYFDGFKHLMLQDSMLFHHFLCPVLGIISFTQFEKDKRLNKKKYIFTAIIPTLIYGVILVTLNLLKVVVGPYPFLMVYNQPWYMSIIWIIVIFVVNYGLAFLILFLNQMGVRITKRYN